MQRLIRTVFGLALLACASPTAPTPGDDPSAIIGHYAIASVNNLTAMPVTLSTTDSLTLEFGDASLILFADGSYVADQYVYEIRPSSSIGRPATSAGHFALHGSTVTFTPTSGVAPELATVVGTGLRLVESVRSGRSADTLVFARVAVRSAAR